MDDNQTHLDIYAINAESGQGVSGVLLEARELIHSTAATLTTDADGRCTLPFPAPGLTIIKPILPTSDLFCLDCDYEILHTEKGVYLVSEPISRLNIYLLPKKPTYSQDA